MCTLSTQRLRRWSNIVQMLYKCFLFARQLFSCVVDVADHVDRLADMCRDDRHRSFTRRPQYTNISRQDGH